MRNEAFPYCLLSSWELRTGTGRGLPAESLRQSHRGLPASWPHPCYGFSLMFPGAVLPCDKRCSANRAKLRSCWHDSFDLNGGWGSLLINKNEQEKLSQISLFHQQILVKAAELCRGVEALLRFLHPYVSAAACKVLLWFTDDALQCLGGLISFPPAHSVGYLEMLRSRSPQSVQGHLLQAQTCAWPSVWPHHSYPHPSRKLRFCNKMLKSHYDTITVYGALCVYFLICMTPQGGRSRSLLAHRLRHPLDVFVWVIAAAESEAKLWSQLTVLGEWGVWETLL